MCVGCVWLSLLTMEETPPPPPPPGVIRYLSTLSPPTPSPTPPLRDANARLADALSSLSSNPAISKLVLRGNTLGPSGGAALAAALRDNAHLTHLNLGRCGLAAWGMWALADALPSAHVLSSLDLRANAAGHDHALPQGALDPPPPLPSWVGNFVRSSSLSVLDLRSNALGDQGGVALALALAEMGASSALTELNLRNNSLGPETGSAMADALAVNASLRVLVLANNNLGPAGGAAIAQALRKQECNVPLSSLNMAYNGLDSHGAIEFANLFATLRSVQENSQGEGEGEGVAWSLKEVNLVGNGFPLLPKSRSQLPVLLDSVTPGQAADEVIPAVVVLATAQSLPTLTKISMFSQSTTTSLLAHASSSSTPTPTPTPVPSSPTSTMKP